MLSDEWAHTPYAASNSQPSRVQVSSEFWKNGVGGGAGGGDGGGAGGGDGGGDGGRGGDGGGGDGGGGLGGGIAFAATESRHSHVKQPGGGADDHSVVRGSPPGLSLEMVPYATRADGADGGERGGIGSRCRAW